MEHKTQRMPMTSKNPRTIFQKNHTKRPLRIPCQIMKTYPKLKAPMNPTKKVPSSLIRAPRREEKRELPGWRRPLWWRSRERAQARLVIPTDLSDLTCCCCPSTFCILPFFFFTHTTVTRGCTMFLLACFFCLLSFSMSGLLDTHLFCLFRNPMPRKAWANTTRSQSFQNHLRNKAKEIPKKICTNNF